MKHYLADIVAAPAPALGRVRALFNQVVAAAVAAAAAAVVVVVVVVFICVQY